MHSSLTLKRHWLLIAPLLAAAFVSMTACGQRTYHPMAQKLGVDGPIRYQYHNLALNPANATLAHDGYIIGIEKIPLKRLGLKDVGSPYATILRSPNATLDRFAEHLDCRLRNASESSHKDLPRKKKPWNRSGLSKSEWQRLCHYKEKVFRQNEAMVVTHIVAGGHDDEPARFLYNIYRSTDGADDCHDGLGNRRCRWSREYVDLDALSKDAAGHPATSPRFSDDFTSGIEALRHPLATDIRRRLDSGSYTHLVIGAAGWDNDQEVSIDLYNSILSNTRQAAHADGKPFKPLFIGLTWPSVWGNDEWLFGLPYQALKFAGYFEKADDADEVGYTIANLLLNDIVSDVVLDYEEETGSDLPVVVFGHSFGARLASRAAYAASFLRSERASSAADLVIGLQPAFSAGRFLTTTGKEGHPYRADLGGNLLFVATTSAHDGANPMALPVTQAAHVGGTPGKKKIDRHALDSDDETVEKRFAFYRKADISGSVAKACASWREALERHRDPIFAIEADEFVQSHGDVRDLAIGRLIWTSMSCLLERPGDPTGN